MVYQSKADLLDRINNLENSKRALPARLTGSPASFEVLGSVSEVEKGPFVTTFIIGGDVMHVTIDAWNDKAVLAPVRHAESLRPVHVDLENETPEVDFGPAAVQKLYETYVSFERGPAPTVADLMAGLNAHVAS